MVAFIAREDQQSLFDHFTQQASQRAIVCIRDISSSFFDGGESIDQYSTAAGVHKQSIKDIFMSTQQTIFLCAMIESSSQTRFCDSNPSHVTPDVLVVLVPLLLPKWWCSRFVDFTKL